MRCLIDLLRRFGLRVGIIYFVTLAAVVAGCWSSMLGVALFLCGVWSIPLLLLAIGALLIQAVWRAMPGRPVPTRLAVSLSSGSLMTLVAVGALVPVMRMGMWLGNESLLLTYHRRYAAIVADVQHRALPPQGFGAWQHAGAITYVVDYGPPRRVAFEPGGFLDNWSGIVWDPTHDVMKAEGFDPRTGRFVAPDRITKLFGGDLVGCQRLGGDWFACSFT